MPMDNRPLCTAEDPMPQGTVDKKSWLHPDAKQREDDYGSLADGGSYAVYECPNCQSTLRYQLPD